MYGNFCECCPMCMGKNIVGHGKGINEFFSCSDCEAEWRMLEDGKTEDD